MVPFHVPNIEDMAVPRRRVFHLLPHTRVPGCGCARVETGAAMKTIVSTLLVLGAVLQPACNADPPRCNLPSSSGDGCTNAMCRVTDDGFPMFDKTCTAATDCVFGVHQTDCCGSTRAIGMNKAEQARFDADEKVCTDQYAQCACPAFFTISEDGQRAMDGKMIVVECQSSQCMTTVK
jgi:hypothetical protein